VYQGPLLSRGGGWGNARYTGNSGVAGYGGRDVIERERRARMRRYECVNAPLLTATRFVGGTAGRPLPFPPVRPAGRPALPPSIRRDDCSALSFFFLPPSPLPLPRSLPVPVLARFFPRFNSSPSPLFFYLILFSRTRALLVPISPRLPRRLIDGTSLKRYRYLARSLPLRRSLVIVARVSRARQR